MTMFGALWFSSLSLALVSLPSRRPPGHNLVFQLTANHAGPGLPLQPAVVMATMPGYKPKSTIIWLEEGVMTVDFILDPEGTPERNILRNIWDCNSDNKSKLALLNFFWGFHLELCFILIVIIAFLCFLFKRRIIFSLVKQRQSTKRSVTA